MHAFLLFMVAVPALAWTTPLSALIPRGPLSQMTVKEADAICGNGQTISCCNTIKQGDDIDKSSGVLSGLLNGVLGGGLAVADDCSKLDVAARMCQLKAHTGYNKLTLPIVIGVQDILNDQCTSNIACCQDSESEAVSKPPSPSYYAY